MSPAAALGPPTAIAGKLISTPYLLKMPDAAPSQAVLCHVASGPVVAPEFCYDVAAWRQKLGD